jgi:septum formation topological specificity factor MinE
MSDSNLIDDDLPTVEIKISKARSGQVVMHERYQVAPELVSTLVDDLNEVIASLSAADQQRVTKRARQLKRRNGKTITRIDLTIRPRLPVAQPSFEQQFKEVAQCLQPADRRPRSR